LARNFIQVFFLFLKSGIEQSVISMHITYSIKYYKDSFAQTDILVAFLSEIKSAKE